MTTTPASRHATVTLHCTVIIYFIAAVFSAIFGASVPGSEWITYAAYGLSALTLLWGAVKGIAVLRRDLGRRRLIRQTNPLRADMADYLGGHPELPQPGRVLALVTAQDLLLDFNGRRIAVPLLATRMAQRSRSADGARLWLTARNDFGPRPADAVDVEFLDGGGAPHRLTLARFRHGAGPAWAAALQSAVHAVLSDTTAAPAAAAPVPADPAF